MVQNDMDRIISYRLGPPGLITQLLPPTTRYADAAHADKHRPDPLGLRGYNCPGWYVGVAIRASVIAIIFGRWENIGNFCKIIDTSVRRYIIEGV